MSEANKALAKRWFEEVWNQGRRETIRDLLAPDAVIQDGVNASVGPEGFYPFFDRMQEAFSLSATILSPRMTWFACDGHLRRVTD